MNKIDELVKEAKKRGSYFMTLTTKDTTTDINNLNHYALQEDFSFDDIVPGIDQAIRSMGIRPAKPVDVIIPEKIKEKRRPLKIAILTHFSSAPESYSPARAVKNQVKILKEHFHEVVFFVLEGSKLDLGCEMRHVVPKFKRQKMVVNEEMKNKFIDVLREHLTDDFDIAITHDLYLADTVTYSEAIKQCNVDIPWLHFARSGVAHDMNFNMPNARYVYLNFSDVGRFAKSIRVDPDLCRVVPNEKDANFMFNWHPTTKMIVDKFKLYNKDIIQVTPVCSTRFDAKGLDNIIKTFVELKRLGNKVALIVANANGRKRADELKNKCKFAKDLGLNEDEFIMTSLLHSEEHNTESELPNQVCAELMQMSNLMIMATIAEVSSNILLEASMTKQLLVLNEDLPCLYDAVDKSAVLSYPFTSRQSMHYSGRDSKSLSELAKQIRGQIKSNKADLQFRNVWRKYNSESIYYNYLEPILYETIK